MWGVLLALAVGAGALGTVGPLRARRAPAGNCEPLRQQSEALCQQQSPRSSFSSLEPPRNAAEIKPEPYPLLEEADLLSDPNEVLEQEERLLNPAPTAPAQPGASND